MLDMDPASEPELLLGVLSRLFKFDLLGMEESGVPPDAPPFEEMEGWWRGEAEEDVTDADIMRSGLLRLAGDSDIIGGKDAAALS